MRGAETRAGDFIPTPSPSAGSLLPGGRGPWLGGFTCQQLGSMTILEFLMPSQPVDGDGAVRRRVIRLQFWVKVKFPKVNANGSVLSLSAAVLKSASEGRSRAFSGMLTVPFCAIHAVSPHSPPAHSRVAPAYRSFLQNAQNTDRKTRLSP